MKLAPNEYWAVCYDVAGEMRILVTVGDGYPYMCATKREAEANRKIERDRVKALKLYVEKVTVRRSE